MRKSFKIGLLALASLGLLVGAAYLLIMEAVKVPYPEVLHSNTRANGRVLATASIAYLSDHKNYPAKLQDTESEGYLEQEVFEKVIYTDTEKTKQWSYKQLEPDAPADSVFLWTEEPVEGFHFLVTALGGVRKLTPEEFAQLPRDSQGLLDASF